MRGEHRTGFVTAAFQIVILAGLCSMPSTFAASAPSSQAEWSRTVEAASKEGQVNVYMYATWGNALQSANVFQKAFPGIRLSIVSGSVSDLTQRIMAERRAGKYLADVIIIGVTVSRELWQNKMLDPVKPALILPEVVDESKWWRGKHLYADPENRFIFKFAGNPQYGSISYNTKLVKEDDFKSIWDFVESKVERENRLARHNPARGRATAPCGFSTTARKSARSSSSGFMGRWISLCFATGASGSTGWPTENTRSAFSVRRTFTKRWAKGSLSMFSVR